VEGESAVVVEPLGELRLASGSYKEKAEELGLVFHARGGVEDHFILNEPAPKEGSGVKLETGGSSGESGLPPGFTEEK
jgi:hypothetical protein